LRPVMGTVEVVPQEASITMATASSHEFKNFFDAIVFIIIFYLVFNLLSAS